MNTGARRLHLHCTGSGSPAGIVENGGGSFSVEWEYDRAGYAWSEPGAVPDGMEQTAEDVSPLLRAAGVQPPYVLAGASLGALHVRAWQRRHPGQVAGLVFVDGSHDEAITLSVDGKPVAVALIPADAEPLNRPVRGSAGREALGAGEADRRGRAAPGFARGIAGTAALRGTSAGCASADRAGMQRGRSLPPCRPRASW